MLSALLELIDIELIQLENYLKAMTSCKAVNEDLVMSIVDLVIENLINNA